MAQCRGWGRRAGLAAGIVGTAGHLVLMLCNSDTLFCACLYIQLRILLSLFISSIGLGCLNPGCLKLRKSIFFANEKKSFRLAHASGHEHQTSELRCSSLVASPWLCCAKSLDGQWIAAAPCRFGSGERNYPRDCWLLCFAIPCPPSSPQPRVRRLYVSLVPWLLPQH